MKYIYIILISALILVSCGKKKTVSVEELVSNGTLPELRAKKEEVTSTLEKISKKLASLNTAIAKLDTVKRVPLITTIIVKETVFNHHIELQGSVKTKQNILVYPEMRGILKRIYVKEGQHVVKGQLLAMIDDSGLSQRLAQVKTSTALAKTTFERQKRLWNQKIGSEIQFLQAKTNYETQVSAVKQLQKQVAKSLVRAPFTGVIDDVIKEPGTVISGGFGSEIFRIVNLKNMYIEAEVPENYITSIRKGKKVEVYFPVLGKRIETIVRQVGSFINPANRSFKIEIGVPNKDGNIKPNLTAKLKINDYTNSKAILIPQSIISEDGKGQQYVYSIIKKEGNYAVAKKTTITTGKTQGNVIEVLTHLSNNSEIVSEGARSVNEGQKVAIKN